MASFLTFDEGPSRDLLAAAGVTLAVAVDGDAPAGLVADVLPEGSRQVRADVVISLPDDPDQGMGAWHVNEVDVVASGRGVMEFVTIEGPVAVVVEAGDVVAIRGAEHRYRPLEPQRWILRFGGPADGDLVATTTGRAAEPWPTPR
jgi:hypothetical protein